MVKFNEAVLLAVSVFVETALSSIYYNNEYFARVTRKDFIDHWSNVIDSHSFIDKHFLCEVVYEGKNNDVKIGNDFLNTEKMKRPPTLVVIPNNVKNQKFLIDVKYTDFTGVLDIPVGYPNAECYIVPPYKPLMYVALNTAKQNISVYALRETENDTAGYENKCGINFDNEFLSKCQVVGPPVSYDYPVHPFFLTASRQPTRKDITVFTVVSIERLSRLVDLAENWDGPMSVAAVISDASTELPEFINAWLSNPKLRRNADVHILFNDKFPLVRDFKAIFPINYLRDVAFKNTRTDLVLFVEGDYVVHKDFRKSLINRIPQFLNDPRSLFIVPAIDAEKGMTLNDIPKNKAELVELMTNPATSNKMKPKPQKTYEPQYVGYWLTQNNIYASNVTGKQHFEPYFVAHRGIMLYDEIFNGCGYDKLSHVNNMKILWYKLKMIPDAFIVHLDHSGLKNYSSWCKGHVSEQRYWLKVRSFDALAYRFKGLLMNVYYPSWLQSKNLKVSLQEVCTCNNDAEIQKTLDLARRSVALCANATKLLSLILFILVVVAAMTAKK